MISITRRLELLLIALLVLGFGCANEDAPPTDPDRTTFAEVIDAGGDFVEVEEATTVVDEATSMEVRPSEQDPEVLENWLCTTRTYDVTRAPEAFPLFDPNAEIIFPGSLLQGASLQQATPDPIPVNRGGGKIVLAIMNGIPGGVSRELEEVSLGSVYDAVNDVLAASEDDTLIPARFQFSMERVQSTSQLALAVDADVSWLSGSFGASMSFSQDQEYNRFLVELNQSFYTVAFELPANYDDMFVGGVTPEELAQYVGPGNPAAFVSSVTFGRIFYLLVESTDRASEMEASINASFSGFVDASTTSNIKYVGDLENVRFKAFALGGDAADALSAVTDDFESLREFLAAGGNIKTGIPISYVVRSVRRPDKVVKVGLNTRYDVEDCRPVRETFGVPMLWLTPETEQLELKPGTQRVTRWLDVGKNGNDAFSETYATNPSVPDAQLPLLAANAVNGEKAALVFNNGAVFRFYGGDLASDAYTITLVARFVLDPLVDRRFEFLGGVTPAEGRVLRAGFLAQPDVAKPAEFAVAHAPLLSQGLRTTYAPDPARFHIYTLAFSEIAGTTIYVDGAEVAYEPSFNAPLTDYLGATLGDILGLAGESVSIAELIAYDFALDAAQRAFLEDDMMRRYKF